ncbi:solute carrier organic anion transporter family member 1A5 [Eupeodes corollae]|uniref:solute carrier organic anion transporter family member 1A5 n=1 Tax=Eupeodes corollae TaxID=290404 RepID=UPI002491C071|nr:solute carrier organic anion transporter family member 1A5 [Eupeodes corollae]
MESDNRGSRYQTFGVNANNISSDSIDCGITKLGWCRGAKCQEFASLKWFVIILSIAGLLQGAVISYFRISAKQVAIAYGYDSLIVEWLLVSNGLFQAVCALLFAHMAHKYHPISWLGGFTMIQGVICVVAIIPAILTDQSEMIVPSKTEDALCTSTLPPIELSALTLDPDQSRLGTLVLLFVLQFFIGMGTLAFFVIGITYIDDNSQSIDSPAAIGAALCASITGIQVGYFITMVVTVISASWWLGWAILGPLVFVLGILLGLFPRRLVKTVVHHTAQRIIEETGQREFGSRMSAFVDDTGYWASLKRLTRNKLLLCNTLSLTFILGGVLNYFDQSEKYISSRFFIPFSEENGLMDEWNLMFVSYFLMPPVAGIAVLVSGLVISKLKLSARAITAKNIIFGIFLVGIFASMIYVRCDVGPIAGFSKGKLAQPYCSKQCICSPNTFLPVCPENSTVTYFSPCYAGCERQSFINQIALYEGCTCGMDTETGWTQMRATAGACNRNNCNRMWILFQVSSISMASLLATTVVGKFLISLRSVLPQDKALALALKVLFVGLFAFVPGKLGYDFISSKTCIYWSQNYSQCLLRETPLHGDILNISTASLILLGVLLDILVFIFAKNLNVYNCKVTDPDYNPVPTNDVATLSVPSSPLYSPVPNEVLQTQPLRQLRPAPKPFVFRSPSNATESSVDTTNQPSSVNGITYAKVAFPQRSISPTSENENLDFRMLPVRSDVPQHHVSQQDLRAQLGTLKSFSPDKGNKSAMSKSQSGINDIRPKSPETDF